MTRSSIVRSAASESLKPMDAKNLMPLSWKGLWDAEITTPASACKRCVSAATAGVGTTPASKASPPIEQIPATSAASIMSPDSRVSRPMRIVHRPARFCWQADARARPRRNAVSTLTGSTLATPLTPSVPNSCRVSAIATLHPLSGEHDQFHGGRIQRDGIHPVGQFDVRLHGVFAGRFARCVDIDRPVVHLQRAEHPLRAADNEPNDVWCQTIGTRRIAHLDRYPLKLARR